MQVWNLLHGARWKHRKKVAKNRHLGTMAQLYRAISLQLRHISTIGKKLVRQQCVLHMSPQYGELRPTNGWDPSGSLRHPCKFHWVSHFGNVTARHLVVGVSQTFAALKRGRHLCSAGWPSRWALSHILVGRSVTEKVRNQTMLCFPTSPI